MKKILVGMLCLFLYSSASSGALFDTYSWEDWKVKKVIKAYDNTWEIHKRVQGINYGSLTMRGLMNRGSGLAGEEYRLVSPALGFNENIVSLIFFPQKNGSYKPLLTRPFTGERGKSHYFGTFGVYEKDGTLRVWLEPDSETGTDRLLSPYTDCGFLTAQEKVAYVTDRRHEPETYYGEFDPKTRKFYIKSSSAPIPSVYWSEWGGNPVDLSYPMEIARDKYRKPFVWDEVKKNYVDGALEVRPKYVYLGLVEENVKLPLICKPEDFTQARESFRTYLKEIKQPALDKELSRMSEHEKATFKREDCDGLGLNYEFGCKQIDDYGRNDGSKNIFPKKVKPPRVVDVPD